MRRGQQEVFGWSLSTEHNAGCCGDTASTNRICCMGGQDEDASNWKSVINIT